VPRPILSSRRSATHTIEVTTAFDAPPPLALPDEASVSVSVPGATAEPVRGSRGGDLNPGPGGLTFFSDTPGSLTLTATWNQGDGTLTGQCRASASTAIQLQAPERSV
jgi:hypothetical protein